MKMYSKVMADKHMPHMTGLASFINRSRRRIFNYAANFEEVEGVYWFGSVQCNVCICSARVTLSTRSGKVRGRILKSGMWLAYEN